jgi:hypothetical protein
MLCLLLVGATALHVPSAHAALEIGGQAVVITTEGNTLTLRAGPGREHAPLAAFAEGTLLTVLAGPVPSADGTLWYQVEGLGLTGWCVAEFLGTPGATPPPASAPSAASEKSMPFLR